MSCCGSDVAGSAAAFPVVAAGAAASSWPPWMVTSGMISATEEFALSRASSPAETVAANAFTSE